MISGPFRGQRLNTLGGHMEVIKKRVNKFGTRSVKQISPKLLTLISPKMFTLISPRTLYSCGQCWSWQNLYCTFGNQVLRKQKQKRPCPLPQKARCKLEYL